MNKVTWIIFSVLTVGFLAILVIFNKSPQIDITKLDVNAIQVASKENGSIADHVYGKTDSKVTLIEYGDYQCPPCGTYYPIIKSVVDEYKDKIRFVFRNFPIANSHPNARAAAATAEAAGLQGKYWEMHDKVYANQDSWSDLTGEKRNNFFAGYAKDLGLDAAEFNKAIASDEITNKIDYDMALGRKAEVDATPTFILNGTKLSSNELKDADSIKAAIEAEITKVGA